MNLSDYPGGSGIKDIYKIYCCFLIEWEFDEKSFDS